MVEIMKVMRKNAKLPKMLGKRVANQRKKLGMSQEYVADKAGISRVYMGYIEQGRNIPALETLQKIARVLKTSLASLVE